MNHKETAEQMKVIAWCELKGYPYNLIYATENERKTTPQAGVRRKQMGVKAAVSDLFLPFPNLQYHGFYIEMKSKTGKPTEKQIKFLKCSKQQGYATAMCYSANEAISKLEQYVQKKAV